MRYISTRGQSPAQSFDGVLLTGLAPDGGLYVPESLPQFSAAEIRRWAGLSYPDLALEVIRPFVGDTIPEAALKACLDDSYRAFSHSAVAPLTMLGVNHWTLELYHGPTLAFKDFALQVLGRLLDHSLRQSGRRVTILGATSGDTGSAALEGCRHSEFVDVFILHPHQRISAVQRRQMTTVIADNVFNLAVEGNFDDCQRIVKAAFADQSFLPAGQQLVAVNSINWARIMVQIVYYFHAALSLGGPGRPVSFAVPTGNFGDIYAGYLAQQMGLPIDQLVVATNANDILHRFIHNNDSATAPLQQTHSPSMDIMVSSNFERYLFDLYDRDSEKLRSFMSRVGGEAPALPEDLWARLGAQFDSLAVDDATTCAVIRDVFESTGVLVDPHTAVGIAAARACQRDAAVPMVTLSTAHPVKFAAAVEAAGLAPPALPAHLADLFERPEAVTVVPNALTAVTRFIASHIQR